MAPSYSKDHVYVSIHIDMEAIQKLQVRTSAETVPF
jgi:hypothetical protein